MRGREIYHVLTCVGPCSETRGTFAFEEKKCLACDFCGSIASCLGWNERDMSMHVCKETKRLRSFRLAALWTFI